MRCDALDRCAVIRGRIGSIGSLFLLLMTMLVAVPCVRVLTSRGREDRREEEREGSAESL